MCAVISVTLITLKVQGFNLSDMIYFVEVNKYEPKNFNTAIVNANSACLPRICDDRHTDIDA